MKPRVLYEINGSHPDIGDIHGYCCSLHVYDEGDYRIILYEKAGMGWDMEKLCDIKFYVRGYFDVRRYFSRNAEIFQGGLRELELIGEGLSWHIQNQYVNDHNEEYDNWIILNEDHNWSVVL